MGIFARITGLTKAVVNIRIFRKRFRDELMGSLERSARDITKLLANTYEGFDEKDFAYQVDESMGKVSIFPVTDMATWRLSQQSYGKGRAQSYITKCPWRLYYRQAVRKQAGVEHMNLRGLVGQFQDIVQTNAGEALFRATNSIRE